MEEKQGSSELIQQKTSTNNQDNPGSQDTQDNQASQTSQASQKKYPTYKIEGKAIETSIEQQDNQKKRFIGYLFEDSNTLTYIGAMISLFSMTVLTVLVRFGDNDVRDGEQIRGFMSCLIIAGICDAFDGLVAKGHRRDETEKMYGVQLDSLADTISFVLAPALFLVVNCTSLLAFMVAMMYMACGMNRLAYFNCITKEDDKHFTGMPVTYIALILPVVYVVSSIVLSIVDGGLDIHEVSYWVYILTMAISAILFSINKKFKKPALKTRIIEGIIGVILIIIINTLMYAAWM